MGVGGCSGRVSVVPERPVEGWVFSGCLLALWKVKHSHGVLTLSLQWSAVAQGQLLLPFVASLLGRIL